jgi:hypothetical protein
MAKPDYAQRDGPKLREIVDQTSLGSPGLRRLRLTAESISWSIHGPIIVT